MNKIYALALGALIAFSGCSKKEGKDNTALTFNNRVNKDVVLSVYRSMGDYGNNVNPLVRKVLKGGTVTTIPASEIPLGKTYYMDWHTDDYYYSNWFNDMYPQNGAQVAFLPSEGNNTYFIESTFTGYARQAFLKTDDLSSKWRAVDAYLVSASTGYVSFWGSMSEAEKYKELTVHKNFTADFTYRNGSGQTTTDKLNFKVHRLNDPYIEFMSAEGASLGYISAGKLPTGTPPEYRAETRDTMMALFPNSDYYFMMVRN